MKIFQETLYDALNQSLRIDKLYFEQKTAHQHLMIFHNAFLGRVMTLDGIVQTTERDEFIYHEMMAHVPILAHGSARKVLIVGGGDGAMLREVLKHRDIQATLVEIDSAVIEMASVHLPNHSQGAFDHPHANIVISDGMDYVRNTDRQFDIIISDSTDPVGPGEALFTEGFYAQCKRLLTPGGVMVAQNGVPFFQLDELQDTRKRMGQHFASQTFYNAAVPTYYGGIMAFAWGSDNRDLHRLPIDVLHERLAQAAITTRYYTPELHSAAFALPRYIQDALA